MGKLTNGFFKRVGAVLIGTQTTNLDLEKFRFGTGGATAEDPSNEVVVTPVDSDKLADIRIPVGNDQVVISAFWAKNTFADISLNELGLKFDDDLLGMRHTTNGLPIADANDYDIRVDVTLKQINA